jgi:hypothetical protein
LGLWAAEQSEGNLCVQRHRSHPPSVLPLLLLLPLARALCWLPQASLIKHAFEALCINEFQGLTFQPDDKGGGMPTGACGGVVLCAA